MFETAAALLRQPFPGAQPHRYAKADQRYIL